MPSLVPSHHTQLSQAQTYTIAYENLLLEQFVQTRVADRQEIVFPVVRGLGDPPRKRDAPP